MSTPTLHRLGNSYDDRNLFLQVALGIISLGRRFKRLLADCGTLPPEPHLAGQDGTDSPDEFLYILLGLVSCSEHLMRHLPATRVKTADHHPQKLRRRAAATASAASGLRHLLR